MIEAPNLRFMPHKGGRLAYREAGSGPALLFLHGMNGSSLSWSYAFQELAPSFRVVAWDAPSFGESDSFGDRAEDYVLAAKSLMVLLKLPNVVAVGHSMGGVVAAALAADAEAEVAGLVLSSTHLGFGRPKGEPLLPRYATRLDRLETKGVGAEFGLERAKGSTPRGTPHEVVRFLADIAQGVRAEGIRDGGRMSQEADNAHVGQLASLPVLILSGGKDEIISRDMHDALVAAFPKARQVVFPDAGHASYAEFPRHFNAQIKEFALNATR